VQQSKVTAGTEECKQEQVNNNEDNKRNEETEPRARVLLQRTDLLRMFFRLGDLFHRRVHSTEPHESLADYGEDLMCSTASTAILEKHTQTHTISFQGTVDK